MISYKERLNDITTFIFDVDGVFTTGEVALIHGEYVRTFNSKDAYAIQYAIKCGFKIYVVTGGSSQLVKDALLSLGVQEVHLKSSNKLMVYDAIKKTHKLDDKEIVYMGDDIPDFEVLKVVGLSSCPQDAAPEIKEICHYQSPYLGGKGCVRDIIEQTMRCQEKWFKNDAHIW